MAAPAAAQAFGFFSGRFQPSTLVCRARDTHGVYARADAGELGGFPGVSAPYELPADADLVIDASTQSVEASVDAVMALLRAKGFAS